MGHIITRRLQTPAGRQSLSRYENWRAYLGFFIPTAANSFTGLYDHEAGRPLRYGMEGNPACRALILRCWSEQGERAYR